VTDQEKLHIDPVCGMEVTEDSATGKSDHKGETYYFCSTECKERFDLDPAEYAISPVPKL
jgi:Cu+-exporting ATPase